MNDDIVLVNDGRKSGRRVWLIVLVVLCAIGVLALLGVLIWNLVPKDYDKVRIENREAAAEISNDEMNDFKKELLALLRNNGIVDGDTVIDDVAIRDGSVASSVNVDNDGGYWKETTFIVDIDSIKQTYVVKMVDSDEEITGMKTQLYCPKLSETKYPASECKDIYWAHGEMSRAKNNYLEYNLPYEFKLPTTGEKVLVRSVDVAKKNGKWTQTVQVYLYSCDEKNPPVAEAEEAVRKWVESLDDPTSRYYTYNIRTGYCEGDAI